MAAKKTRPVRIIAGTDRCLVRVGPGAGFFVRFDPSDGRPLVTQIPSHAWHGSYQEGDEICTRLQDKNYSAGVTDIFGQYIDLKKLEEIGAAQSQREVQFWNQ